MFKRRYTLMDLGVEIISHSKKDENDAKSKRKTMYLIFKNTNERDFFYNTLHKLVPKDTISTEKNINHFTDKWVNG